MYLSTERTIPSDNPPVCPTISKRTESQQKIPHCRVPVTEQFLGRLKPSHKFSDGLPSGKITVYHIQFAKILHKIFTKITDRTIDYKIRNNIALQQSA
ncbi:hypothetical protein HMPREF9016_01149 [Neisseria sp. oral taxon 014 str. F0314]|nr:hypothetical protein HMPREF9016_01149 [Neisseria sp. oral taxon 014 str. F0314]